MFNANLEPEESEAVKRAMVKLNCKTNRDFLVKISKMLIGGQDIYVLKEGIKKQLSNLVYKKERAKMKLDAAGEEEQTLLGLLAEYDTQINTEYTTYKNKILTNISRKLRQKDAEGAEFIASEQQAKLGMKIDEILKEAKEI